MRECVILLAMQSGTAEKRYRSRFQHNQRFAFDSTILFSLNAVKIVVMVFLLTSERV